MSSQSGQNAWRIANDEWPTMPLWSTQSPGDGGAPAEDRLFETMPVVDRNWIFAFMLFAPMLFTEQFGSWSALLFVLVTAVVAIARHRSVIIMLRDRWFLLVFPAFALLSTLWSNVPFETFKHASEFTITVLAAVLLVTSRNPKSMLVGLFCAFVLYTAISVIAGHHVDVGNYGARALSGLNDSKNEEADIAATGFVISFSLFLVGVWTRKVLLSVAAAGAAALQIYVSIAALSSGALAGSTVAFLVIMLLFVLRRTGRVSRAAALGTLGFVTLAIGIVFEASGGTLLRWLASTFDKDPTLTGRTYLWLRAKELVSQNPLFGQGFGAFWQQGNLDADGLWQFAGITTQQGFNFHNTLYDSLVSLGWIGTAVLIATFAVGLASASAAYVRRPTYMACFWLGMAAYMFIRMPTESVGVSEFYFSTVLVFALLGAARAQHPAFHNEPMGASTTAPARIRSVAR